MSANRVQLVVGNWKMHRTVAEAEALSRGLIQTLADLVMGDEADGGTARTEIVLAPPFTALAAVAAAVRGTRMGVAAQNMYWQPQGAFTGEISPLMVAELADYVILGHSERRTLFAETNADVGLKVAAALAHGLVPIVCVGETWAEREAGATDEVVGRQLTEGLMSWAGMGAGAAAAQTGGDPAVGGLGAPGSTASSGAGTGADPARLVVAYEPVWAIGTGHACEPEEAQRVAAQLRIVLAGRIGVDEAARVRILYGGSVNPVNSAAYLALPDIDGALVGGSSLDADAFATIVRSAG